MILSRILTTINASHVAFPLAIFVKFNHADKNSKIAISVARSTDCAMRARGMCSTEL